MESKVDRKRVGSYDIVIVRKEYETGNRNKPLWVLPARAFLMPKEVKCLPRKPKRPCSFPNCPNLTDGRFCEEHEKQENKRYEKYGRDPAIRRRYGRAWKRIRDSYISQHPLCEECEKKGKLIKAEEVHHILPLSRGGTHDRANLMALCKSCHSAITAKDGDRWSRS